MRLMRDEYELCQQQGRSATPECALQLSEDARTKLQFGMHNDNGLRTHEASPNAAKFAFAR